MSSDQIPSFPQFALLPPEIRRKIWYATLRGKLLRICTGPQLWESAVWQWSPHKNPVALSVCLESRACALSLYTIKVPVANPGADDDGPYYAARYIDPVRDLIMIQPLDSSHDRCAVHSFNRLRMLREVYCGSIDRQIRRDFQDRPLSPEDGDQRDQVMLARSQEIEKMVFRRVLVPQSLWPRLLARINRHFRISSGDLRRAPRNQNGRIRYLGDNSRGAPPYVQLLDYFREIYIVAELSTTPGQQGHASPTSETLRGSSQDFILPHDVQEGLEEWGWKVERNEHAGAVDLSHSYLCQTTKIQDLFYADFGSIDLDLDKRPPARDISFSGHPWNDGIRKVVYNGCHKGDWAMECLLRSRRGVGRR